MPEDAEILLCWGKDTALITSWNLLVKHYSSFWYPSSDDLTVFAPNLQWAILFFHTGRVYYGTK